MSALGHACLCPCAVPASDLDLDGDQGIKRDARGMERLKQKQAKDEIKARAKYEEVIAKEALEEAMTPLQ